MEPAGAKVTYQWYLNGAVVAATETYTVPASAKDGDEIKLVVTDADGDKVEDTVYVGGLTILFVEPTTAGAADYTGFKYIRATFSTALTELAPSQIEIRRKSDKQLYSVESVVLSADGKFADITLFGDSSAAGTFFLQSGPIYTMKVTQNGDVATLDFELPAYNTEAVVTSVDMSKNKVTVTDSGKTQKPVNPNTYNVANKYDGNLGALVGRAVTFGYDSDNNMTSFSLLDQQVVYGCMKGFKPSDNEDTWYYKDVVTGEKYYCEADTSASNRETLWIQADGSEDTTPVDYNLAYNNDNTEFKYVKLVLNPNGTIATATVEKTLPNTLYVKEVNGTIVTQDVNNAFDLDGYIIVEDGDYIKTSDLEEGDIIFLNPSKKFAEVYVNAVSGEISDVIDGKLSIDGKAYEWYGAQYWDDANDKFVGLAVKNDTEYNRARSQDYLNSLDPEETTTIYLGRDGKIKYLEGTPVEEVVTTTRELIIGQAKGYDQSLDSHLRIPAFDGTENDTIDVIDSKLKTMFGDKGKVEFDTDPDDPENSGIAYTDEDNDADGNKDYSFADTDAEDAFPATYLVDVVRNSDGVVTGFKPLNYAVKANGDPNFTAGLAYTPIHIATIDGKLPADADNITSSTKKITTTANGTVPAKTLSLGSYTNIWYYYDKEDGTIVGTKWSLDEFPSAALASEADNYLVYSDGTKATDIVVIGSKTTPTIKTGDTSSYSGIVVGNTMKTNSDGKNVYASVKMILTDGTTETFDVAEDAKIVSWNDDDDGEIETTDSKALVLKENNNKYFATAVVRDTDGLVTQLTVSTAGAAGVLDSKNGWTVNNDYLPANRDKVSSKLQTANGVELTVSNPAALLLKYTEEGSTKFRTVTYGEINTTETKVDVWYHTNYTDASGKIEADMIIVTDTGKAEAGDIVLNAIAANKAAGSVIGTADLNDENATFALVEKNTNAVVSTLTYNDGNLVADSACDFKANTAYRIVATPSDDTKYWTVYSDDVTSDAAVLTTATIGTAAVNFTAATAPKLTLSLKDQFNDAITAATVQIVTPKAVKGGTNNDGKSATASNATWASGTLSWTNAYSTTDAETADALTQVFKVTVGSKAVNVTVTYADGTSTGGATATASNVTNA